MKKLLLFLIFFTGITNAQYKTDLVDLWRYEDISIYDGSAMFDLSVQKYMITNVDWPFNCTVEYYTSMSNAYLGVNKIINFSNFNGYNGQEIYAKIIQDISLNEYYDQFALRVLVDGVINFPDATFKSMLLSSTSCSNMYGNFISVDSNSDGEIQLSEANKVYKLFLSTPSTSTVDIGNLSGVENFKNLIALVAPDNLFVVFDEFLFAGLRNLRRLELQGCNLNSIYLNSLINLRELGLQGNNLTSINVSNLNYIDDFASADNPLSSLNINHLSDLRVLKCYGNNLTSLNLTYFPKLSLIQCEGNQLTSLDFSQNLNLTSIRCQANNLVLLNIKNGQVESLNFSNNPNLQFICVDDSQLVDVQSKIALYGYANCNVNSYCSFIPGGNFNTITGSIIYDGNANGCEVTDVPQPNIKIDINDGVTQGAIFSNNTGNYSFYTEAGSFTLTPSIENPAWFTFLPTSATISFVNDNNNFITQNFCVTPSGIHSDLEIVIAPISKARPGFNAVYKIVYKNKGNQNLSGNVNFQYNDENLDFVSATTVPDSQLTGNLVWNYTNLMPFESRSVNVTLNVNSPTETPGVNIDDVLSFTAIANPVSGDETISDNTFQFNQTVVGSFDPNDKTCIEGIIVSPTKIGDYLHYNINFENTGTFQAENIVVKDVIDVAKFDINTLQVIYASHPVVTRVSGGKTEFIFENINLGASQKGNVVFKIKTKSNLVVGNSVSNLANIYFDYNFPIVTNTSTTAFQVLSNYDFVLDSSVTVFPNPTKYNINISAISNIKTVQVYDVQGRLLETGLYNSNNVTLDLSRSNNGIYLLKIITDNGLSFQKVIKE